MTRAVGWILLGHLVLNSVGWLSCLHTIGRVGVTRLVGDSQVLATNDYHRSRYTAAA